MYNTQIAPWVKEMWMKWVAFLQEQMLKLEPYYGPVLIKLEPYKAKATEYLLELKTKADPYLEPALTWSVEASKVVQEKSILAWNATSEWYHAEGFPVLKAAYEKHLVPAAIVANNWVQEQTAVLMKQLEPHLAALKGWWEEQIQKLCGPLIGMIEETKRESAASRASLLVEDSVVSEETIKTAEAKATIVD